MTLQHKNWKGKIIRHCGLGHEVQESWPYLSNATPWPYELSHVKIRTDQNRLEQQQKRFLKIHFEFAYFSFLLIWNQTITTFIHSRISFENHTRFQTEINKVQTKTAQNPYPLGRHMPIPKANMRKNAPGTLLKCGLLQGLDKYF